VVLLDEFEKAHPEVPPPAALPASNSLGARCLPAYGLDCRMWAIYQLIDSCITQLKAQEPARTCNESKEEEEDTSDSRPVPVDTILSLCS